MVRAFLKQPPTNVASAKNLPVEESRAFSKEQKEQGPLLDVNRIASIYALQLASRVGAGTSHSWREIKLGIELGIYCP